MQRLFQLFSLLTFIFISSIPAFASDAKDLQKMGVEQLNSKQASVLKEKIKKMSDQEFDHFIVDYMQQEKDKDLAKEKLKKLDVDVYYKKCDVNAMIIDAWEVDYSVTAAKRAGDAYYRLITTIIPKDTEPKPASYDKVGINWDPSLGTYYNYAVCNTSNASLYSASKKSEGLVVFNLYDSKFIKGSSYWVAVYVTPKATNTWMDFGMEYEHTYAEVSGSFNQNGTVSYTYPGVISGTAGFNVNLQNNEKVWQVADTNAVLLR